MVGESPWKLPRRLPGTVLLCCLLLAVDARSRELRIRREAYRDRVHAVWAGQIVGMLLAYTRQPTMPWPTEVFWPTGYGSAKAIS
jgi:hypothetical protein